MARTCHTRGTYRGTPPCLQDLVRLKLPLLASRAQVDVWPVRYDEHSSACVRGARSHGSVAVQRGAQRAARRARGLLAARPPSASWLDGTTRRRNGHATVPASACRLGVVEFLHLTKQFDVQAAIGYNQQWVTGGCGSPSKSVERRRSAPHTAHATHTHQLHGTQRTPARHTCATVLLLDPLAACAPSSEIRKSSVVGM